MKPPRALLVDLDGTLVDTAEANYLAYAEALAPFGVAVERARWDEATQGRNWRQFLPAILENVAGAAPETVAARKAQIYPSKLAHSLVNRDLAALIARRRRGCRSALVTTASAANAAAVLRHHGLEGLFDTVVTAGDVERHKPFPDAYRVAAERLAVAPHECLVFEDSEVGLAAAAAFGAPWVRVRFPAGGGPASIGY
jgi:beta-phosphoglucomutase